MANLGKRAESASRGSRPGTASESDRRRADLGPLEAAIEAERSRLFRAEAIAGCLRVSLNELWLPDIGQPDFASVANVIENLIGDALEGLDQALLSIRRVDAP